MSVVVFFYCLMLMDYVCVVISVTTVLAMNSNHVFSNWTLHVCNITAFWTFGVKFPVGVRHRFASFRF